jgi:myosin heavy subunit
VSPQAVYKKLTKEFINKLDNHIQLKESGKYLLDDVAERDLKELFNQTIQPVEQLKIESVEQPLLNQLNSENSFLRQRVEGLEQELKIEREHGREQSDKLSNLASQLAELSRNNQILLGAEQSRTIPILSNPTQPEEPPPPQKSFWSKIFKRKHPPKNP